jgi:hypothetical protein
VGFVILAIGLAADVAYHAVHGLRPHVHSSGFDLAQAIHWVVAAGMLVTLAGVVRAGVRSDRRRDLS